MELTHKEILLLMEGLDALIGRNGLPRDEIAAVRKRLWGEFQQLPETEARRPVRIEVGDFVMLPNGKRVLVQAFIKEGVRVMWVEGDLMREMVTALETLTPSYDALTVPV